MRQIIAWIIPRRISRTQRNRRLNISHEAWEKDKTREAMQGKNDVSILDTISTEFSEGELLNRIQNVQSSNIS